MDGVRQGFVNQEEIEPIEQARYMLKHNDDYWVCLIDETPVGYVGVIDNDIRVATHPDFQGKGIGAFMITEVTKVNPFAHAKVKLDDSKTQESNWNSCICRRQKHSRRLLWRDKTTMC